MERGGSLILGCERGEQEDEMGGNLVKRKKGDGFRRMSNSEGRGDQRGDWIIKGDQAILGEVAKGVP